MQCVEITGAGRQIDMGGVFETVILAQEGRNGFGPAAVEMPDRRSPHVEGFDGGLGDQLRGLELWVRRAVTVPRQPHDQRLLSARTQQLVQLGCGQRLVERGGLARRFRFDRQLQICLATGDEITDQQFSAISVALLADFDDLQGARGAMQAVADPVVVFMNQLLLDLLVQSMTDRGLHQAGIRRFGQRAELAGGDTHLLFACRIEIEQCPAGLVQPLETQQAKARGHRQLRHNLGRQAAGGIGMYFHRAVRFQYADRVGQMASSI